ncbi:MAG: transglycosylase SLT domain-containing protein [Bacteroidales bacterium]|jgi:membrane-bound lytic murein transglycosylase D|nr:transglycosylase SLT domain-containing protein [Bacteroidales bacterium]
MKPYNYLIYFFLIALPFLTKAQKDDTDEVIVNFERNYDSLLNSYHIRQSTRLINKTYHNDNFSGNTSTVSLTADSVLARRLRALPSEIPLTFNSKVRRYMETYVDKISNKVSMMLGLSKYYFPLFESILDRYGVPIELKYLVVIESALNPNAVSRMGATGLWQFMYATASHLDLRMNSVIDERRDPIKATEAAAKYLKSLYRIYNDWTLALAAYNCGPGNVNKAMQRSGGSDFWAIYDYLPRETRGYVPAFIGATYAFNYYQLHGINAYDITKPVATDTVTVTKDIHFGQIATVMQIDYDLIKDLNPQYKKFEIPGSQDRYIIKLPTDKICRFIALEDSIANYERDKFFGDKNSTVDLDGNSMLVYKDKLIYHKVRRKETWSSIARRYGVSVSELKSWNPKSARRRSLAVGASLAVKQKVAVKVDKPVESDTNVTPTPFAIDTVSSILTNQQEIVPKANISKTEPKQSVVTHKVKKGETLFGLSKKYDVPIDRIISLNKINKKRPVIRIGQILRIK